MGDAIAHWATHTMESMGYIGIALLMFLENLFPPIPSELIMPLAGFTVARGQMNFGLAVLAGVLGTVLGALPWYYLGCRVGEARLKKLVDRYGKWLSISGADIDRVNQWFDWHGKRAVFFGRLVPGIRTLISLPAGLNAMPLATFLVYSTIGTALWTLLLTTLGYVFGENYALIGKFIAPISKLVLAGLVGWFVFWVIRRRHHWKRH